MYALSKTWSLVTNYFNTKIEIPECYSQLLVTYFKVSTPVIMIDTHYFLKQLSQLNTLLDDV